MIFNEEVAKKYDKWYKTPTGKHFDNLEKQLILKVLKPKPNESLLEIGCGTGHFLKWFKTLGLNPTGVDNSPAMLTVARNSLDKDIELLQIIDPSTLPYADNQFDIVIMITTLEFLNEPKLAVKEALRVARSRIFLGVLNKYSWLALKRRLKGLFKDSIYKSAKFYSIWELKGLIKELNKNLNIQWETVIPNLPAKNPFGAFIGSILIKK